jgi:hypothetical protein
LLPIQVQSAGVQEAAAEPLGTFGPPDSPPVAALEVASLTHASDGLVEIELTWYALGQSPRNYWQSIRLQDASGATLSSRDIPPMLGGYPTSLWQPGERLVDRVLLPWPEGAAEIPAQVEIVLYDRATLASIGSVTVPLTQP